MQNHNRLFSHKQIVGISLFLFTVLLFVFTGFQFNVNIPSLPTLTLPNIPNPFDIPKIEDVAVSNEIKQRLNDRMGLIDNTPCDELPTLKRTNSGWATTLLDHIEYRLTVLCK